MHSPSVATVGPLALQLALDETAAISPSEGSKGLAAPPRVTPWCNENIPGAPQGCTPDPVDPTSSGGSGCKLLKTSEAAKLGWNPYPIEYSFVKVNNVEPSVWEGKFLEAYDMEQRVAIAINRTLTYMYYASEKERKSIWELNDPIYEGQALKPSSFKFWFGPYSDNSFLKVFFKYDRMYRHKDIVKVTNDWSNYPGTPGKGWNDCSGLWGANNFVPPNNERWVWLCGKWTGLSVRQRWTNLMHELSHVKHKCNVACCCCDQPDIACGNNGCRCDSAKSARALIVNNLIAVALENNANYDVFADRFAEGLSTGICWPPHRVKA